MSGEQFKFLRNHLGYSGEQLAAYLHTDKTRISKWERGADPIGHASDRLMRLLVSALDDELLGEVPTIAAHLPTISNRPGAEYELRVNTETLITSFVRVKLARSA